jgi:hypothetical protein
MIISSLRRDTTHFLLCAKINSSQSKFQPKQWSDKIQIKNAFHSPMGHAKTGAQD